MYLLHLLAVLKEVEIRWIGMVSEEIQGTREEMNIGETILTGGIKIEMIGGIGTEMTIEGIRIDGIEDGIEIGIEIGTGTGTGIAKGGQIVIGMDHVEMLPLPPLQVPQALLPKGRPPLRVRHP